MLHRRVDYERFNDFKLIIIKMKYRKIISQNLSGLKKLMNAGFLLFGGGAGWCLLMLSFYTSF
jgi:hypothetical protein